MKVEMKKRKAYQKTIMVLGFLLTLYWVEGSSWGSKAVALYNEGYGTFDMKKYNTDIVEQILSIMKPEGYRTYYRYLAGDYLFILFFGSVQAMVSRFILPKNKTDNQAEKMVYFSSIGFVILRGIADFIENTLLLITLVRYPVIHKGLTAMAACFTQIKLWCIRLWGATLLIGMIIKWILKIRKKISQRG